MQDIRVSVIVPVHNSEAYLSACLDSILGQSEHSIELICVDDGSSDRSLAILNAYADKDNRVKVIHQTCKGAGAARNTGLKHAAGTYLSFLDSDDFFEPQMLEDAANKLDASNADIVVFGSWLYDTDRNANRQAKWTLRTDLLPKADSFNRDNMSKYLFNAFGNYTWNKLFRTSFITSHGLLFQEISRTNDLLFVCSALAIARNITVINASYVHYRISPTSLQATNDRDPLAFFKAFCALEDYLTSQGLYQNLKHSFLNHALDGVVANISSLKSIAAVKQLKEAAASMIEPRFHFLKQPDSLYEDKNQLHQYKELLDFNLDQYLFSQLQRSKTSREEGYWHIDWIEWEKWKTEQENNNLNDKINQLLCRTKEADRTIEALRHELAVAQKENESLKLRIESLEASRSYRIGKAITAPVRIIKERL